MVKHAGADRRPPVLESPELGFILLRAAGDRCKCVDGFGLNAGDFAVIVIEDEEDEEEEPSTESSEVPPARRSWRRVSKSFRCCTRDLRA